MDIRGLERQSEEELPYCVGLVPLGAVSQLLPRIMELFVSHPVRGASFFATNDQVAQQIASGQMLAWVGGFGPAVDLVMLVEVRNYPAARGMRVVYLGGNGLKHAMAFLPVFDQWAVSMGCTHAEAVVSPALARVLRRCGYVAPAVYVYKPLITFSS